MALLNNCQTRARWSVLFTSFWFHFQPERWSVRWMVGWMASNWEGGGVGLEEWRHGNLSHQEISLCTAACPVPGVVSRVESAQMGWRGGWTNAQEVKGERWMIRCDCARTTDWLLRNTFFYNTESRRIEGREDERENRYWGQLFGRSIFVLINLIRMWVPLVENHLRGW